MKWFEFDTDFFENKFVKHTQNEFGDRGVLAYIKILALIYKDYDIEKPGKIHISWQVMTQLTHYRQKKLISILDFFQRERKLEWQDKDGKLWLYVPKTLERADEYTKKIMRKISGHESKNVRTGVGTKSAYNTLHYNTKDIDTTMETTKEPPLKNPVFRILQKMLKRGEEKK